MTDFRTVELSDPGIDPAELRFMTVKSPALGARADITLFVPDAVAGLADVPVVMLLHGVYGSHWAWALKGGAHLTAQRLIDDGAIPPLVLAMPSDGLWGDGSGYVPHRACDFERWIVEEVPAAMRFACPACGPASPIAIIGLSMGGFAALRLAGKYPSRFAAVAAHSAAVEAADLAPLIEESQTDWSDAAIDRSALAALRTAPADALPPIHVDCGVDDPYLAQNRRLHEALDDAGIAHDYAEHPGAHDWDYWRTHVAESLRFVGVAVTI
ncbi:MAG TPA: alpha/beta fold hydrolase [Sphingomonas sp.]|nr:alpha/beta fold hydrolase [Sphingomonas sp.]